MGAHREVGGCSRRREKYLGRSVHHGGKVCLPAGKQGHPHATVQPAWFGVGVGVEGQRLHFPNFRLVSMMVSWSSAEGKVQQPVYVAPHTCQEHSVSNAGLAQWWESIQVTGLYLKFLS